MDDPRVTRYDLVVSAKRSEPAKEGAKRTKAGNGGRPARTKAGSEESLSKNVREEQLVQHALSQFSNGGFRETSLQEIADKLGITRPLFYYYFDSKESLLWRIVGRAGDQLLERARPIADSGAEPEEKVRNLLEAHAFTLLNNVDTFRVYFAERHLVEGKRNRQLKRGEEEYLGLYATVIGEGQRAGIFRRGNRRVLALIATGAVNSLLRWYEPGGIMSADGIGRLAADIVVQGMKIPSDDT